MSLHSIVPEMAFSLSERQGISHLLKEVPYLKIRFKLSDGYFQYIMPGNTWTNLTNTALSQWAGKHTDEGCSCVFTDDMVELYMERT